MGLFCYTLDKKYWIVMVWYYINNKYWNVIVWYGILYLEVLGFVQLAFWGHFRSLSSHDRAMVSVPLFICSIQVASQYAVRLQNFWLAFWTESTVHGMKHRRCTEEMRTKPRKRWTTKIELQTCAFSDSFLVCPKALLSQLTQPEK